MERQMAKNIKEIRKDHLYRYQYAKQYLKKHNMTKCILDAGCGIGYGSYVLADEVIEVDCIERSSEARDIFLENNKMGSCRQLRYTRMSGNYWQTFTGI